VTDNSATLTRQDVEHVAHLARLALTEDEVETYRRQLSAILQHAAVLERLDIESIAPTASVLPLSNVMRDDDPQESLSQSEALANAPSTRNGYFQVKAILE